MLNTLIPAFETELEAINNISNMGSILAFNVGFKGPEHFYTSYPDRWVHEYEAASLHFADPAVVWPLMNVGNIRWSEIKLPDIRGVFKKARCHDINYGALFSRQICNSKTIMSVSRHDRELTDAEMNSLSIQWDRISNLVEGRAGLTGKEMEVLALARDGLDYKLIAAELDIGLSTVKMRVDKAKAKLGAKSLTHAVVIAVTRKYFTH